MRRTSLLICAAALTAAAISIVAVDKSVAELPSLIPRELLLGNPERTSPSIAPDASKLAWIAPDPHGVLQVWVQTLGKDDAQVVTADKHRGISNYAWAWDSKTILYSQDSDGDENFHTYAVDLASNNVRDLTPWQGVRCELVSANPKFPDEVLLAMNIRDRKLMDVYRVNIKTGAVVLDTKNPGRVSGWLADDNMVVRSASISTPDGGTELQMRTDAGAPWHLVMKGGKEDRLGFVDFSKDGRSAYLISSVGRDTTGLFQYDIASAKTTEIAHDDAADISDLMIHPTRHVVQAVAFDPGRMHWKVIDPSVQADFDAIAKVDGGDVRIVDRDLADKVWILRFDSDRAPSRFYSWDRAARKATFLFTTQPKLEGAIFAAIKPVEITARDGMHLNGYLALPPGLEPKSLPMVLNVHGGPWARDSWGFNGFVQLLANRGYAVLMVNFRGSSGFGKKYLHSGDLEWGRKMQDDLTDAVNWAVQQGYADPKRVAIYGGSYGGYAALAGAAFTPGVYKCAIDVCGPSNLFTLLESFPPYWESERGVFLSRMGDPATASGKELLRQASPLFSAEKIAIPLLIGQGANDPRVKQAEAEQIVAAIEKHRGNAVYVLYSDEGHGFARPENRLDFTAREEKFLADNLGGRFEPMTHDPMPGSTAKVRVVGAVVERPAN